MEDAPPPPANSARRIPSLSELSVPYQVANVVNDPRVETFDTDVCPACGAANMGVTDSRPSNAFGPAMRRRVRRCGDCGCQVTTLEVSYDALARLIQAFEDADALATWLRAAADRVEGMRR